MRYSIVWINNRHVFFVQQFFPSRTSPKLYPRELVLLTTFLLLLAHGRFSRPLPRACTTRNTSARRRMVCERGSKLSIRRMFAALGDYRNALSILSRQSEFSNCISRKRSPAPDSDEEARAYLFNLLSESPGSGQINLELARIAARTGPKSMPEALRYYHALSTASGTPILWACAGKSAGNFPNICSITTR